MGPSVLDLIFFFLFEKWIGLFLKKNRHKKFDFTVLEMDLYLVEMLCVHTHTHTYI